jgi:methionyl aminopeptidase
VGHEVHELPDIPNYGQADRGFTLEKNMTIAIEPMAALGKAHIKTDDDGWTIRTIDSSLAAHFEHTVLVLDQGCEILTVL